MDDDRTRAQLAVLRELQDGLAAIRVRWWLRGGWAIDFMLGRITKIHDDIDIVVWGRQKRRVSRVLLDAGFTPAREFPNQTDFRARGEILSVIYLARAEDGRIVTEGIPVWEWPPGSLGRRPRHLEGIAARLVSPRQMLWEKEGYERGTGRPPRPKDLVSMQTLREIIVAGVVRG